MSPQTTTGPSTSISLYASAAAEVGELLAPFSSQRPSRVSAGSGVAGLHSSDFNSLDEFKRNYFDREGPVLCFLRADEIPEAVQWLRPGDDIAIAGEPIELSRWRLTRIAHAMDQRLDPLTKVFCREELISVLQLGCQSASPFLPASLVLADVDRLKALNDHYGIPSGDNVLKILADLIKSICERTFVARTRGGEFAIYVEANGIITKQIATIVRETINQFDWPDVDRVTASFGVATALSKCDSSTLLTRADEALFAAKANGRDQVVTHEEIAELSQTNSQQIEVISLENKARVMSERVTSFVTQQSRRIMNALHREAITDGLTELFNRRYFDKQLRTDFNLAIANKLDLCLAMVDLDHFGKINKAYGWPTGDKALCSVTSMLTQSIRASDWVGRYGGEEICIVMPGTKLDNAVAVCERVRSSIESANFHTTADHLLKITVSIGVVELDSVLDRTSTQLVERVSQLTLRAKDSGRNLVVS